MYTCIVKIILRLIIKKFKFKIFYRKCRKNIDVKNEKVLDQFTPRSRMGHKCLVRKVNGVCVCHINFMGKKQLFLSLKI